MGPERTKRNKVRRTLVKLKEEIPQQRSSPRRSQRESSPSPVVSPPGRYYIKKDGSLGRKCMSGKHKTDRKDRKRPTQRQLNALAGKLRELRVENAELKKQLENMSNTTRQYAPPPPLGPKEPSFSERRANASVSSGAFPHRQVHDTTGYILGVGDTTRRWRIWSAQNPVACGRSHPARREHTTDVDSRNSLQLNGNGTPCGGMAIFALHCEKDTVTMTISVRPCPDPGLGDAQSGTCGCGRNRGPDDRTVPRGFLRLSCGPLAALWPVAQLTGSGHISLRSFSCT